MVNEEFLFGTDVIERVIREIDDAREFIKMAVFQIHNMSIYEALERALKHSVNVKILTLPYESVNPDIRAIVKNSLERIKNLGAEVNFNKWNIGDPERTTTAVGRWYSYHGKFIITDRAAIALSANMTDEKELDAMLIYYDAKKIDAFNSKYNNLLDLFIKDDIIKLVQTSSTGEEDLFLPPRTISEEDVRKHWIVDYPSALCPKTTNLDDGLYISPIDCRARDIYEATMNEAQNFIYISTESFTDVDIMPKLIENAIKGKEIKILTGGNSQDFNDRIRKLYPQLIANGIDVKKPGFPLHAKLLLTEKRLIVSSVNMNKINLGYGKTRKFWRANTETMNIESNDDVINRAKIIVNGVFDASLSVLDYFTDKEEKFAKSIFNVYGVRAESTVRKLFAYVIVRADVKAQKNLYDIGKYASIILNRFGNGRKVVSVSDFSCSLILYYLSERKGTKTDLKENLKEVNSDLNFEEVIDRLTNYRLIEKDDEFYKINIKVLLGVDR